jgi:hypothetical protein
MRLLAILLLFAGALPARAADPLLALAGVEMLLPHLARAAPFPRQLALARAMAAGDAEWQAALAPLAGVSRQGAPSSRQLRDGFGSAATEAVLAEMGEQGRLAWLLAATMRFGARHLGGETPALAATAAAEARLRDGDLAGAEAALAALAGPAAAALAPWRQDLARRLAADTAARQLEVLLLRRLP